MRVYTLINMELTIGREKIKNCAECTCFNLRKASRIITQLFDRTLKLGGLRSTQYSILAVLSVSGPMMITRLSEALATDRTTLTRNLKPMENAELITIVQGSDLRTKTVSMTKKGQQTFGKSYPYWEQTQNQIIGKFGKKRFISLIRDLSEVSEMFSARAAE